MDIIGYYTTIKMTNMVFRKSRENVYNVLKSVKEKCMYNMSIAV